MFLWEGIPGNFGFGGKAAIKGVIPSLSPLRTAGALFHWGLWGQEEARLPVISLEV